MAPAAVGLSWSAIKIEPQNCPPQATYTTVPTPSSGTKSTPIACIRRALPTPASLPSASARTPWPATSCTSAARAGSGSCRQAARKLLLMGWLE